MLHLGQRHRGILDAEVGHGRPVATEVGDQRVVGVQGEVGPAGSDATTAAQRSAIVSSSP